MKTVVQPFIHNADVFNQKNLYGYINPPGKEMELIGVEKQEWESTLRISMERLAEIERLNNDIKNLAKLVLKLSPERKEWLEKHYGEYL